jgi:hypothetical protein
MTEAEIFKFLNTAADGQPIRLTTASGRTFSGVYNAEDTSPEDALYFETMDGKALRAEWPNITSLEYRNPQSVVGGRGFVVPPEHPMSGVTPSLRPYTSRNK